jgi:hypothetical protein
MQTLLPRATVFRRTVQDCTVYTLSHLLILNVFSLGHPALHPYRLSFSHNWVVDGQVEQQITYSFHPNRPLSGPFCPIYFSSLSSSLWKAPLSLPPHTPREQVLFSTQGYLRRLGTCFARSAYNTGTSRLQHILWIQFTYVCDLAFVFHTCLL